MGILTEINVPKELQRNDPKVLADGVEHTGETLLASLARRLGRRDLGGLDLLDVGCGVRFTQTLINRSLPFNSYTGIDVYLPVVQWLRENVESKDQRFCFSHWNVHNHVQQGGPAHECIRNVAGERQLRCHYRVLAFYPPRARGCFSDIEINAEGGAAGWISLLFGLLRRISRYLRRSSAGKASAQRLL
jgi:hypothetical protein